MSKQELNRAKAGLPMQASLWSTPDLHREVGISAVPLPKEVTKDTLFPGSLAPATRPASLVADIPLLSSYPLPSYIPERHQREMKLLYQAQDIMGEAIAEYAPSHVFVLFSGGYDSLVTTHLATAYLQKAHAGPFKVAHINTNIGIEETRQFVRDMRERYQWPYVEYKTRSDYREIVCKHGFPGPAFHKLMYILLKERPLDDLIRDHTDHEQKKRERPKIMFITGVRRQESQRRMGHVEPVTVEGRRVWVAPLTEWEKTDVLNYIAVRSLSHNEVVDTLHMSGECLCGAYAHVGELTEIETFYPKTGQEIREIEQLVRAAGFPWGWEDGPPAWFNQVKKGQAFLEGFDPESTESHLCATCDARFEGSRRVGS